MIWVLFFLVYAWYVMRKAREIHEQGYKKGWDEGWTAGYTASQEALTSEDTP